MFIYQPLTCLLGCPRSLDGKESTCNAQDFGSNPGEWNDCSLQYTFLENSKTEEPGRLQSMCHKESDMIE